MSSDSAHRPLYLRASNVAQASGDNDASWPSLQEKMTSRNVNAPAAADGEQQAVDDDKRAPPPEDGEFWLAPQDRTASHINEEATAADGRGRETDERVFADLMGYPQKPAEGRQSEESETEPETDSDDESSSSTFPSSATAPTRKGVSFSSTVEVKTIPHRSSLSPSQRERMYNSSVEIHQDKIRNEKEFRYDDYDWRNATEECDMDLDEATGELVHPAHEYGPLWL